VPLPEEYGAPGSYPPAYSRTPGDKRLWSDAHAPWGWADVAILAGFLLVTTLAFGVAIVLGLAAFGLSPLHVQRSSTEAGLVAVVAQILADIAVMIFLAVQARVRFHAPFWTTLGWRRLDTGGLLPVVAYGGFILGGFALAAMVAVLDSAFPAKKALPIEDLLKNPSTAALFMLTAVLLAPLVEETVFRGYLFPVCVRSFGISGGILATGTIFGLLHSFQLWGGWWQIVFLIVVGIVLTVTRAITGTVVASYLIHASYNALPVIAYIAATHGFRQAPAFH
jgi:membrane protease YdiL (CAAX protease family)